MTGVALYACYSADNQIVASIDHQVRICREHAAREKLKVVDAYYDGVSDASVILRPGIRPSCGTLGAASSRWSWPRAWIV
jgi:hypothetical protein